MGTKSLSKIENAIASSNDPGQVFYIYADCLPGFFRACTGDKPSLIDTAYTRYILGTYSVYTRISMPLAGLKVGSKRREKKNNESRMYGKQGMMKVEGIVSGEGTTLCLQIVRGINVRMLNGCTDLLKNGKTAWVGGLSY